MTSIFEPTIEQISTFLLENPPLTEIDGIVAILSAFPEATLHQYTFDLTYSSKMAVSATMNCFVLEWKDQYWYQGRTYPTTQEGVEALKTVVSKGYEFAEVSHHVEYGEDSMGTALEELWEESRGFSEGLNTKRKLWEASFIANLEKLRLEQNIPSSDSSVLRSSSWRL